MGFPIYILGITDEVVRILYSIVARIDLWIYSIVGTIFDLLEKIYDYQFFGKADGVIDNITRNVYIALAVVMMFRIIMMGIQYVVNPDLFDDKEKGLVGLLKNAIITVLLIAFMPTIFAFALDIQGEVVKAIPNLIFRNSEGTVITIENPDSETSGQVTITNPTDEGDSGISGSEVAFAVLQGFISVNNDCKDCGGPYVIGVNSCKKTGNKVSDDNQNICDLGTFNDHITDGMKDGYNTKNHFHYMLLISTAGGVFMIYILLSMSLDIAIRTIKLGIIQMLSPIPIASYMFKKDNFNKFVKISFKVYADLFIRMAVVYIIILAVQILVASKILEIDASDGGWFVGLVRNCILLFALFKFAKDAPKFITELLGLPDISGGDIAGMFKRAGAMVGTGKAAFDTARSNYVTQKERALAQGKKSGVAAGLRGALAGAGSATARGLLMSAQGKGFKETRDNAFKKAIGARNKRNDKKDIIKGKRQGVEEYLRDENGNLIKDANGKYVKNPEYYSRKDYRKDIRRAKLGIPSDTAFMKIRYDTFNDTAKAAAEAKSHGVSKANETPGRYQVDLDTSVDATTGKANDMDAYTINQALGYTSLSMGRARELYQMAKAGHAVDTADGKSKVNLNQSQIEALGNLVQKIEKRTSYMKEAELMGTGDPAAVPNLEKMRILVTTNRNLYNNPDVLKVLDTVLQKNGVNAFDHDNNGNIINGSSRNIEKLFDDLQRDLKKPPAELVEPVMATIPKAPEMPVVPEAPVAPTFNLTMPVAPTAPSAPLRGANRTERTQYAAKFEQYKIDLANYNNQMQDYNRQKAEYDAQVAAFSQKQTDYNTAMASYNAQKAQYDIDIQNYNAMKATAENEYNAAMADYNARKATYDSEYSEWISEVNKRANILAAVKDAYEQTAKSQFATAQYADRRAQNAQKAVNNNDKNS